MASITISRTEQSQREIVGESGVRRAFLAALLLTGNMAAAENSVQEAIGEMDGGEISSDQLFRATLEAAVKSPFAVAVGSDGEEGRVMASLDAFELPIELHRVLLLPTLLRHCFVLRLLLGLSREQCAELLQRSASEIDENTVSAVQSLALWPAETASIPECLDFAS